MKDIGLLLRQTREERGLKIEDAAIELKIRPHYLEAIENGEGESLSGEIYTIGYVKSYAKWLGISGNNITKTLKKSNKGLLLSNSISSDSGSFFSGDYNFINPNARLVLLSIIITIAVYFSSSNRQEPINDYSLYTSSKETKGMVNLKDDNRTIILMANEPLNIYITASNGLKATKEMTSGEIYFLPNDNDTLITSDKPASLDVFIDREDNSFLGTLDKLS